MRTPETDAKAEAVWHFLVGMTVVIASQHYIDRTRGSDDPRDIARLKQRTLMLSIARATDYERWRERKALGQNVDANDAEEDRELEDVKPIYQAAMKTSPLLVNKSNILPLLLPALIPLLIAGATFLSYSQIGPIAKRLLFL